MQKSRVTKGLVITVLMATGVFAHAQYSEEPKLTRDLPKLISPYETRLVEVVRTMPDDTYITVEGLLVERVAGSEDIYLLKDESGEIKVEIDEKLWAGQVVSKKTPVKILGELEQSEQVEKVKMDAFYLEILDQ